MNIFLAPNGTSIEYTRKNFETILCGRPYDFVEPFLKPEEKEILSKYETLKVWGVKTSWYEPSWAKMRPGDYVLFYERKHFCYSAKIIIPKHNEELAKRLWHTGEYSCLFFVDSLKEINIPLEVINKLAGYELKKLEQFIPLHKRGLAAIEEEYGGIEKFIDKYSIFKQANHIEIKQKVAQNLFVRMYHFLVHPFRKI